MQNNLKFSNNIKETLEAIWLKNNESDTYLQAIKLWTVPASIIANKLNLPRTTIRYACESLVKKWLFIQSVKWNTKYFTAEHPNKIKNLLQIEKNKIEAKENRLNNIMSQITQMYSPYTKISKVTFYEWEEWLKKVLFKSLESKETIDSYIDIDKLKIYSENIDDEYVKKRKELKIKKRTIYSDSLHSKESIPEIIRNSKDNPVKFLNANKYNLFISFMAYDNKVSYITLEENNIIWVIIENKEIYNFHKNIFQFMWDNLD